MSSKPRCALRSSGLGPADEQLDKRSPMASGSGGIGFLESHRNLKDGMREVTMPTVETEPYVVEFDPRTAVLVIIDMQRDFVYPGWYCKALESKGARRSRCVLLPHR